MVRPQGELLGSAIAGDHPPGPGTHGPGFSGAAGAALDGSTLPGGDGKRICGANRHAQGKRRWETVTLVEHGSGLPVASHSFGEEGGEVAAVRALLEEVDLRGRTVTLDALHTCRDTERALVEQHGAHYLLTVKNNCPETCRMLETVDWESRSRPQATQGPEKGHGRIETRRIDTFCPPPGLLPFSHAKQAFRVTRKRYLIKEGVETVSFAYGITSAGPQQADAAQLLEWNRGHWSIENRNHYRRDTVYGEDQSRIHTHHGPANNATISNAALAIVLHAGFANLPESIDHYQQHREAALATILAD